MNVPFANLEVGESFMFNGNTYFKKSTRTGFMIAPAHLAGIWFYFSKKDMVRRGVV